MMTTVVLLAFLILLSVSGLHFYWVCGGRWGLTGVIPTKAGGESAFVPRRLETMVVAILTLTVGVLLLAQNDYFADFSSNDFTRWGCLLCGFVFLLRSIGDFRYMGFTKRIKGTLFAVNDTWFYSPLCLFISAVFVITAL